MRWYAKLAGTAFILALAASPVGAQQESGRVALDLGYPPALALLWRASDHFALRPELAFSYDAAAQTNVWTLSPGVSALVPVHASGALTPYAGARLVGLWQKGGAGPTEWLAEGLVGARYTFERHFGVSGETGVAYTRLRFLFAQGGETFSSESWSIAPTGRVSALLYF